MTDVNENEDGLDEDIEALEEELGIQDEKKLSPKKIVLFIVLPLLVLIGVGAGLYFSGVLGGSSEEANPEDAAEQMLVDDQTTGIFYDIPDIIVNLNSVGRKPRLLQISISLELAKQEDIALIDRILPRVLDHFQTYLRELRAEDLKGSAGIYRLRIELLARVNAAAYPEKVRDVLFREILVQ